MQSRSYNRKIHKRHHYYYREKSIRSFLPSNQLHSVLESDVPEEVAHALLVVDPPDALRQQDRDVHGLFQRERRVNFCRYVKNTEHTGS